MPRVARVTIPGAPHHVTQRGNNRQVVFRTDDDRRAYLALLREQAEAYGLEVLGYCLMANHAHLVVVPRGPDSLAKAIGRTHWLYAQYVNRRRRRSGHLWQGRFFSCALDEARGWEVLRYVERNPVRARIVRCAWRYPWSSAAAHCGAAASGGLLAGDRWRRAWDAGRWKEWLRQPEGEEHVRALRVSTSTGRPLGSDSFLSKLERTLGRRLRPRPVGRPKVTDKDRGNR